MTEPDDNDNDVLTTDLLIWLAIIAVVVFGAWAVGC